jgi:hypothetical protein
MHRFLISLITPALLLAFTSCGGSSTPSTPAPVASLTLQLASTTVNLLQDGTPTTLNVTATCVNTATPSIMLTGLPAGVNAIITQPTCSQSGNVVLSITDAVTARAATYPIFVHGTSSAATASASLSLNAVAQASVSLTPTPGSTAFMSTSFQRADWSYSWLHDRPAALAPLNNLDDSHIRIQLIDGAIPQLNATTWDFTKADEMIQPILTVGDHSPQLQIGTVPTFLGDSNGNYVEANLPAFAAYCANLVRYYNTGGFTVNGVTYKSPSATPIVWWGIFNEPNINNVTPDQYATMYNTVAAAMLAVDPTIKLVALELSDWGNEPQRMLPTLLAGATQPIHAMATHYYGSCNQKDTDSQIFAAVDGFTTHVSYFRSTMDANVSTRGVPIWITENNVNADWAHADGTSACNPGTKWVEDDRGTSAYFAAWRAYVYSQLVKAGAAGVWHWSYAGGGQYGELTDNSTPYLSYWVDSSLSHIFGQERMIVLTSSVTEPSRIEIFAAQAADGSRWIMLINRDVAATTDNNGPGVPKTVALDLSAAGPASQITLIAIDKNTGIGSGPVSQTLTPVNGVVTLAFPGYGVQFIQLR